MWLALRFEHWALDCRGEIDDGPALVVETIARHRRVIAADLPAIKTGIRRGMGLADARMRLANVVVHERNPAIETAALTRLAGWAWRYSSQVHWAVAGKNADGKNVECARLALEIGASLRLFGGRRALLERIRGDLRTLGYRFSAGIGDTPQAALAFARARRTQGQRSELATLSLDCLALDTRSRATLATSGIRRAGELLALPPSALAHRFGSELLRELDRLRGRAPHGLALYHPPPRYRTRHELTGAVDSTQGLIFVIRRVFAELAMFLRGADSAIQTLRLELVHERAPATPITLALAAPCHDAGHLERVTHEQLDRLALVAPVVEIRVKSGRLRPFEHVQNSLWRPVRHAETGAWPAVLDRLRARLGYDAVKWLEATPDHRPEHASGIRDTPPASAISGTADAPPRPLWLLDSPEPLALEAIETMTWLSGPERIESGWWDHGQRRDYYRAIDTAGRLVWVFCDLNTARRGCAEYFLHGLFG